MTYSSDVAAVVSIATIQIKPQQELMHLLKSEVLINNALWDVSDKATKTPTF